MVPRNTNKNSRCSLGRRRSGRRQQKQGQARSKGEGSTCQNIVPCQSAKTKENDSGINRYLHAEPEPLAISKTASRSQKR